ncbi:MAG: LysR family transcriptional regulator [Gemmobacter sp.]|uniref:hydrogen peroxide-inducible genes activator n=1 Tax=Gemmobacter sp. TaxID=1898957 RepID=UPI001A5CD2F1|nr:hydrogen peroxide-inducible genes activator [Gemmobacter sp.]MBL8563318.1 LysR family transcriptional regulator [Gemmobacter sp.]
MLNITLKQLRYFEALARLGHFGQAAEVCAVTQPALSMQMKELEAVLGAPLLERAPRQVRLTGFGELFLARAQTILREVSGLEDLARLAAAQASGARMAGRLRIGVIPTVAPYLLPKVIARLTALYPGLELSLRETVTPRLLQELQEGRLDCALVALPVSEPGLEEMALFSEAFVLVRPEADAGRPVPDPAALREMRLLLLEEGHCFRDQALSFCAMSGVRAREVMDGSSLATLVQMVGAGIGVTLIPEMAVEVETRSAAVSVARFREPQPMRQVGLVWRRSNPLAEALREIAGAVQAAVVGAG